MCVNQQVGHVGLDARCAGFAAALEEAGLKSECCRFLTTRPKPLPIMDDYMTAKPDVDLWLTLGPNGANPFLHVHG